MNRTAIQRKWRVLVLNCKIALFSAAMRQEPGITNRWKGLARDRDRLIHERNQLRTTEDLRRLERKRGLQ